MNWFEYSRNYELGMELKVFSALLCYLIASGAMKLSAYGDWWYTSYRMVEVIGDIKRYIFNNM